ncbi:hypothetical protein [Streptomyces sp. HNM0574]|uniref:hypothetical protein n=1 Tax=Streptomyces sp. HNM0574 TaxID=2714954 RepID=UPI001F0E0151|nr:hypothetical protein [Streptomyces sp. HNM0574]
MTSQVNLWNVAITRAKSQLITVGGRAFWQGQSGLPVLLAERAEVLDTAYCPGPGAETEDGTGEQLVDRLQDYLGRRGFTGLERTAVVGGQTVDLLFTAGEGNTAVLIDRGAEDDLDPARHLRLTHARGDLLMGLPSGGSGAKPAVVTRTVRVPAWRIVAGEAMVEPLFP